MYDKIRLVARETAAVVSDTSMKGGVRCGRNNIFYSIGDDNITLHKEITVYSAK